MPVSTNGNLTPSAPVAGASRPRDLFGGAITAVLPSDLIDASDLRQIPDNQEVLLSPNSDVSVVLEVLEAVKDGQAAHDSDAAVRFHFGSIAHDNSSESSNITSIYVPGPSSNRSPSSPPTPRPTLLSGTQKVVKYNSRRPNAPPAEWVRIRAALWRLSPHRDIDLVLSVNEPIANPAVDDEGEAREMFEAAASSLRIEDWSLFAIA